MDFSWMSKKERIKRLEDEVEDLKGTLTNSREDVYKALGRTRLYGPKSGNYNVNDVVWSLLNHLGLELDIKPATLKKIILVEKKDD